MLRTRSSTSRISIAGLRRSACSLRSWGKAGVEGCGCLQGTPVSSVLGPPKQPQGAQGFTGVSLGKSSQLHYPRNPPGDSPMPRLQVKYRVEAEWHAYTGFRVGGAVFDGHDRVGAMASVRSRSGSAAFQRGASGCGQQAPADPVQGSALGRELAVSVSDACLRTGGEDSEA